MDASTREVGAGGIGTNVVSESPLAFDEFFQRFHPRLFAAMCLTTGDRHDAEEIAQDAFLRVLARWDRVVRMDDPDGFLFTTAMNVFRKRYRRAKLASRLPIDPRPHAAAAGRDRPHDDPGRSFRRGGRDPGHQGLDRARARWESTGTVPHRSGR